MFWTTVWLHQVAVQAPIRSHSGSHAVRISKLIVLIYMPEIHKKIVLLIFPDMFSSRTLICSTEQMGCCSHLSGVCWLVWVSPLPFSSEPLLVFSLGCIRATLMLLCWYLPDCFQRSIPGAVGAADSLAWLLSMWSPKWAQPLPSYSGHFHIGLLILWWWVIF